MLNELLSKVDAITAMVAGWSSSDVPDWEVKSLKPMDLRDLILKSLSVIKSELSLGDYSVIMFEIDKKLDGIICQLQGAMSQAKFAACVDHAYDLYKILNTFGYFNERINKVIRDSLKHRNQAALAHEDSMRLSQKIKKIEIEISGYQSQIESFHTKCFKDDANQPSYAGQLKDALVVCDQIVGPNGLYNQIRETQQEIEKIRQSMTIVHQDLIDGSPNQPSVQKQIIDLFAKMRDQQNEISQFVNEYLTGEGEAVRGTISRPDETVRVSSNESHSNVFATESPPHRLSKKAQIDQLHASLENFLEIEKAQIQQFMRDFEHYQTQKKSEIEGLLKGATNVQLASAFSQSQSDARRLRRGAEIGFVMVMLAALAWLVLPNVTWLQPYFNWGLDRKIEWAIRLLGLLPLLWLGWFQTQKAARYFQKEQTYEHKANIARSFEAYQSQITTVDVDEEARQKMLSLLLTESIDVLAKDPGEKHTPSDSIPKESAN